MMANQENTNRVIASYLVDNGKRKTPQQCAAYAIDFSIQKGTFSYSVNGLQDLSFKSLRKPRLLFLIINFGGV